MNKTKFLSLLSHLLLIFAFIYESYFDKIFGRFKIGFVVYAMYLAWHPEKIFNNTKIMSVIIVSLAILTILIPK